MIAVFGAVLGTASLAWQAATYVLSGGRVKIELLVGAMGPMRSGMALAPVKSATSTAMAQIAAQGFREPIMAVRVRNVGRLPVTVTSWGIRSKSGMTLSPAGLTIGPSLPHRLEAGDRETWAVGMEVALNLVESDVEVFKVHRPWLRGTVELGDGRVYRTRRKFRP